MEFYWNSANIEHIALHHITPEKAEQVIENDPLDAGAVLLNSEFYARLKASAND